MDRDAGKLQHENIHDHERIRDRDAKDEENYLNDFCLTGKNKKNDIIYNRSWIATNHGSWHVHTL